MTRPRGAVLGAAAMLAVVSSFGAIMGSFGDIAPRHGPAGSLDGALSGAGVLLGILGAPALLLGGALGAVFARGFRGVNLGALMGLIAAMAVALILAIRMIAERSN